MIKRSFLERAATEKKVQRFLAVADDEDAVREFLPPQSMQSKIHIVLIVFDQQYVEFF
jgi:hypothetical protein